MKYLLFLFSILVIFSCEDGTTKRKPFGATTGRKIYVSNSNGNDSRTISEAGNPETPWKSIAKLNASMGLFFPGDSILFKKGDVWEAVMLDVKKEGLYLGSYGDGNRPELSGLVTLKNWTSAGGNIQVSEPINYSQVLNVVTVDDKLTPQGRWPNKIGDPTNEGWRKISSFDPNGWNATDVSLSTTNNFSGGLFVTKTHRWIIDSVRIKSHVGNKFNFSFAWPNLKINWGWFITDHPQTLDLPGEWYFNRQTRKLSMYMDNPTSHVIKASVEDTVIKIVNINKITIDGLRITGANKWGVGIYSSEDIKIINSMLEFNTSAVWTATSDVHRLLIHQDTIRHSVNYGLDLRGGGSDKVVTRCHISHIGMFEQHTTNGSNQRFAINSNSGTRHRFAWNTLDTLGYVGIKLTNRNAVTDSSFVEYNKISNWAMIVDDAGGIYCGDGSWKPGNINNNIILQNNIIWNGQGNNSGQPHANYTPYTGFSATSGIYIDDGGNGYIIRRNHVYKCGKAGLFLHNNFNDAVYDNTFYDCYQSIVQIVQDGYEYEERPWTHNMKMFNNLFISKTAKQEAARFFSVYKNSDSNQRAWARPQDFDRNYYVSPYDINDSVNFHIITRIYKPDAFKIVGSLKRWQLFSGYDLNSKLSPIKLTTEQIRHEVNATEQDKKVNLGSIVYMDGRGLKYSGVITIPAMSGLVLLPTKEVITPVPDPNEPDTPITPGPDTPVIPDPDTPTPVPDPTPVNQPPVLNIIKQTVTGNVVDMEATATDADGIAHVKFYRNGTLLVTEYTAPYTCVWSGMAAGIYNVSVVATDKKGLSTTKGFTVTIAVVNKPPVVRFTSPTTTSVNVRPSANVVVTAVASDPDGSIVKVLFYNGTTLIKQENVSPYSWTWNVGAKGTKKLTAVAYDNKGVKTTSAPITLYVK